MSTTNNVAFTAPLNPPGATTILKTEQIWAGLLLKIRSAQTFVPKAIQSTAVISETHDSSTGNPVTVRDVVFREDQRTVRETVTAYKPSRVLFSQPNGSVVNNIVSEGADGELYMTYTFEWNHPDASQEELGALLEKEKAMARGAVEGTITKLRELVESGNL
ncbi:hypothetical protein N7468_007091 [Penicillium chermesinum]|uniref:DUF1857-domain-containing protein n=1 Tax=Penicillium chermesinum TaxID=63820 RepID=A0A9W9NU73_9EURO|nr:uncharacterized protein N7468_007091 [Penicillium chermesinum]KAJ5225866.1 hypothetical protein N7468_007091 [Penicillium chermesinum]KAJ6160929.1 hypothetical protein N7470_004325 [Penicillium chermesinum]